MVRHTILVVDDFLFYPRAVRGEILEQPFADYVSEWDGVTYPGICQTVPAWIQQSIMGILQQLMGAPLQLVTCFARATYPNVAAAPNKIHSDRIMGQYAAHIYLSQVWPPGAGTSFWRHPTEGEYHTERTDTMRVSADANNPEAWSRYMLVQGKFNRLVIHDADLWHCAEPIGGWGEEPSSARLVLTTFFRKI